VTLPVAIAYDSVSQRFVVADEGTNTLKIVAEASGHAMDLVSPGWAGNYRTTAIAIDHRRGDLWAVGVEGAQSAIHRLQLVSGRRLDTIAAPKELGATSFVALSVSPTALFILDTAGRRVFSLASGSQQVRIEASLPSDLELLGLGHTPAALYVSHATGVMRIDLSTRGQRALGTPKNINASGLRSLAWDNAVLYAVQQSDEGAVAVRVRLNTAGTAITAIERIEPARSNAATLAGGLYHYLGDSTDGAGAAFRRVQTRN
jgi:hypothetical protein